MAKLLADAADKLQKVLQTAGQRADATAERMAEDSSKVVLNEKVIERLAEVVPEELMGLFDDNTRGAIEKAAAPINRRKAAEAAARSEMGARQQGGRRRRFPKLDEEQQAEWLYCALTGNPPLEELDGDEAVSKSLKLSAYHARRYGEGVSARTEQALTVTTGSAGGYLLPDDFVAEIYKREALPEVVWNLITKRRTGLQVVVRPKVSTYPTPNRGSAANAGSATSATEITETEAAFGELTWTMRYFDARWICKLDMLEDSPIDVMDELLEVIADGFRAYHEEDPIVGTGSAFSRPLGLLASTTGITTIAISAALTLEKLLKNIVAQVPVRYRRKSSLLMNSTLLFKTIQLLAENVRAAQFLVGYLPPLFENDYVHDGKIIAGDFSKYVAYINRLMYMVSAVVPGKFARDIVVVEKWDGQCVDTDAFRIATGCAYA
jgi:HK97 family phage major capsid protein